MEHTVAHGTADEVCSQFALSCVDSAAELRKKTGDVAGLSELFKVLSDETRTKILYLLSERELCVCDLAYLFNTTLPAVSHHLKLLRVMRLVKSRREGKNVFYSLNDDHVPALIRIAREHFTERTEAV